MSNNTLTEPEGIAFFNVKSGETHYAKLEPTIQAYINSSDMGINASRDQNFGWKLGAEWVKRVKAFRRDTTQMSILTARNGGQKPSTVQILYHLYGEELRAFQEEVDENDSPFEDQYQQDVAGTTKQARPVVEDDDLEISELVDDADLEPAPTPVKSLAQQQREAVAKAAKQTRK